MKATKDELLEFLEKNVFFPGENNSAATETIKKKIRWTRTHISGLTTPEEIESFFWNAMASDNGIDSYTKISGIGANTFEDVRSGFKKLCGRK
ncbi:hypothetical protein FACS189483_07300 [Spirochaetia bacterium]|nr:hypothetical protein FACS189483_07300 [Spirochaetia bacterium]